MAVGDTLREKLKATGTLSERDLQQAQSEEEQVSSIDTFSEEATVKVSTEPTDQIMAAGDQSKANKEGAEAIIESADTRKEDVDISDIEVTITADDKAAFLDSVITNERYTRPFSLFGGRVTGTFRSKTAAEAQASVGELERLWQRKLFLSVLDYTEMSRLSMLRFQLAELNNVQYPVVTPPLRTAMDVKTGEIGDAPPWMGECTTILGKMPAAMVSALYEELKLFERKYWEMTEKATDQNFWVPEASI